jgi:hypothetical protein
MPLNMGDPYLRAERQPPALVALGVRLKAAYGVGADNFGIKGNEYHYDGFHRSRNYLLSPNGPGADYSTRGSLNQGGNGNNNSAFDFTPGVWGSADNRRKMIDITKRLRAAARAHDARLADYFEFAGTEDGKNVVTFYAQGGEDKSPFDPSHLDHIHGSKYRSRADNDDSGVGDVILGVGGGSGGEEDDDMGASFGPIEIQREGITSLTIPPVQGGIADPRPAWLNLCNATGDKPYGLRVWVSTGNANEWHPLFGSDGLVSVKGGQRIGVALPAGTSGLDIRRWGLNAGGTLVDPKSSDAIVYDGHLTVAIERGAVGSKG